MDLKLVVAQMALKEVLEREPEILGVGSGRTVRRFIELLGKSGFRGKVVSTSFDTTLELKSRGFKVLDLMSVDEIDVSVDGADEFAVKSFSAIKGGGAALLREKVVAELSNFRIYVMEPSKVVESPCERGVPIPIEISPVSLNAVTKKLREMGVDWKLREGSGKLGPIVTDNGNLILDLECKSAFEKLNEVKSINGVASIGVFERDLIDLVLVSDGRRYAKGSL